MCLAAWSFKSFKNATCVAIHPFSVIYQMSCPFLKYRMVHNRERVFVSYVMTSIRGLDQTEGCNQHRRKAGFKHEENRCESQVVNRRCTKQDRQREK